MCKDIVIRENSSESRYKAVHKDIISRNQAEIERYWFLGRKTGRFFVEGSILLWTAKTKNSIIRLIVVIIPNLLRIVFSSDHENFRSQIVVVDFARPVIRV